MIVWKTIERPHKLQLLHRLQYGKLFLRMIMGMKGNRHLFRYYFYTRKNAMGYR